MEIKIGEKTYKFRDDWLGEDLINIGFPPIKPDEDGNFEINTANIETMNELIPYMIKLASKMSSGAVENGQDLPIVDFKREKGKVIMKLMMEENFLSWVTGLFDLN